MSPSWAGLSAELVSIRPFPFRNKVRSTLHCVASALLDCLPTHLPFYIVAWQERDIDLYCPRESPIPIFWFTNPSKTPAAQRTHSLPWTPLGLRASVMLMHEKYSWKSAKSRLPPSRAIWNFLTRTRFLLFVAITGIVILIWNGLRGTAGEMQR